MSQDIHAATKRMYQARSQLGVATRAGDKRAAEQARQNLAAAKLERHIAEAVASAPPLTAEQLTRISGLLRPIGGADK